MANIGIIARSAELYAVLEQELIVERVARYLSHVTLGKVSRYSLPGILAFNFTLENALGGGGVASLRYDPQGKALAQMLLDMQVNIPISIEKALL